MQYGNSCYLSAVYGKKYENLETKAVRRTRPLVVEERDAVRDHVDVFHQPVVQFAAHAGRELADEAQCHRAREYGIV